MVLLFTEVCTLCKRISFFFKKKMNKTIETEVIVVLRYDIS